MGGVLVIAEAYFFYCPENGLGYGQKAIQILLHVIENNRDDLVVILAGYEDKMAKFSENKPGFRYRIAHYIKFPNYTRDELLEIVRKHSQSKTIN